AAGLPPGVKTAAARIEGARLETDVRYLADDRLEGRGTGTRGYDVAARYVAARMESLGLQPAGTTGYLQPVPLRRAELVPSECSLALVRGGTETPLVFNEDFVMSGDFLREKWTTEAPLAFVGYGVSAPELGYDDYAGIDVRGKVVVMLRGAPPRFGHNERAYYSNGFVKEEAAAAHGVVGILNGTRPDEDRREPWPRVVRGSKLPGFRWTDSGGAPVNAFALIETSARLSPKGLESVFLTSPTRLDQAFAAADSSRPQAFDLGVRVKARRVTRHANVTSPNVVGLLRGSDPRLANECIVISAHLDHLGISTPVNGDSINNGAYDNASGTAMMLETARAFASLGAKPRRSILFLSVTGEEKGLQGSDYFARNPAPLGLTVVGDVNLDMVLTLTPLSHVIGFGAEHSSMGPILEQAARLTGMTLIADPMPAEVVFVRSDQFSFVKQGVPSIFPTSGGDGTPHSLELSNAWRTEHYHSPSDDMAQPFDWPSAARFTRMAFYTAWLAADGRAAPRWNDGDFFGKRFGARR
ncbi:MAG: M28 family metallopeptidase, partial [Candidatus Eisenbacteria bacterium]